MNICDRSTIDNFYDVYGQASKGCKWIGEFGKIIQRLKYREKRRIDQNKASRIEFGTFKDLESIVPHANRMEKEFRYFIVLSFDERLSMLIDAQDHDQDQRRMLRLLRLAKLKYTNCLLLFLGWNSMSDGIV